ncbi:hypothetical protein AGMMS49921_10820 [Endomicrobiia bacterium]|nr:hypothetical protein AGMMS49921_10820 [Endomicrobiia bacterium]
MRVGVIKDVTDEKSTCSQTATAEVSFGSNILYNAIILVPKVDGNEKNNSLYSHLYCFFITVFFW